MKLKISMIKIIERELYRGTFDKTCTVDERMELRQFVFYIREKYKKLKPAI